LHVLDGSDPLHPVELGTYQVPGLFRGIATIAASGPLAYATDAAGNGLHLIDVSQPDHPTEVGAYHGPGHANGVALAGHYAYVADGFNSTLHVLDVSDPARPVEVGSHQFDSGVNGVVVSGSHAYVATANTGLQIVDVGDPRHPVVVGAFSLGQDRAGAPVEDWTVAVAGSRAYVPDAVSGLHVLDVSDPARPVEVGRYPDRIDPYVIAVSGSFAYVASGQPLLTLDVSNPAQPTLVATTPLRASARDVAADGRYVYVAHWTGLDVIDVGDSRHPTIVGSLDGLSNLNGVAVSGGTLVFTDGIQGVHDVDASDPRQLRDIGLYPLDGDSAGAVRLHDGLAYVSTLFGGLFILRPAPRHDARYFPETGFRIDSDVVWDYFNRRGGANVFGYPVSRTFSFQGFPVQFFQRLIVQLDQSGHARLLNVLDSGLMPYTSFNGATFPSVDSSLVASAPNPSDAAATLAFVKAHAPDSLDEMPVSFYQTFANTVSYPTAFPNGGDPSLLPGIDLEIWGIPTSNPQVDPNNRNFVYLRFQRGIMHYDASCNCTRGVLLADYLKAILTGQNLPADLNLEAQSSPFYKQYDPGAPDWVRDPSLLRDTDLTNAFTQE
jgi:hypothetical protein